MIVFLLGLCIGVLQLAGTSCAETIKVIVKDQKGRKVDGFRAVFGVDDWEPEVVQRSANDPLSIDYPTDLVGEIGGEFIPHDYPADLTKRPEILVEVLRDGQRVTDGFLDQDTGTCTLNVGEPGVYLVRCCTTFQIEDSVVVGTSRNASPEQLPEGVDEKGPFEFYEVNYFEHPNPNQGPEWGWVYHKRYTYQIINSTHTHVAPGEADTAFVCLPRDCEKMHEIVGGSPVDLDVYDPISDLTVGGAKLVVSNMLGLVFKGSEVISADNAALLGTGTAQIAYLGASSSDEIDRVGLAQAGVELGLHFGLIKLGIAAGPAGWLAGITAGVVFSLPHWIDDFVLWSNIHSATIDDLWAWRDVGVDGQATISIYNLGARIETVDLWVTRETDDPDDQEEREPFAAVPDSVHSIDNLHAATFRQVDWGSDDGFAANRPEVRLRFPLMGRTDPATGAGSTVEIFLPYSSIPEGIPFLPLVGVPGIGPVTPAEQEVAVGLDETVRFEVEATDAEGTVAIVEWHGRRAGEDWQLFIDGEDDFRALPNRGRSCFSFREPTFDEEGLWEVRARVYNDRGLSSDWTWQVSVAGPAEPSVVSPTGGGIVNTVALDWDQSGGTDGYQVRVIREDVDAWSFGGPMPPGGVPDGWEEFDCHDGTGASDVALEDYEGEDSVRLLVAPPVDGQEQSERMQIRSTGDYGAGVFTWRLFVPDQSQFMADGAGASSGVFAGLVAAEPISTAADSIGFEIGYGLEAHGESERDLWGVLNSGDVCLYMNLAGNEVTGSPESKVAIPIRTNAWHDLRIRLEPDDGGRGYVVHWEIRRPGNSTFDVARPPQLLGFDSEDAGAGSYHVVCAAEHRLEPPEPGRVLLGAAVPETTLVVRFSEVTVEDAVVVDEEILGADDSIHVVDRELVEEGIGYRWRVRNLSRNGAFSSWSALTPADTGSFETGQVLFNEPALEEAIRLRLGNATGEITVADMEGLHSLDASGRKIADLSGLEFAVNLVSLDLSGNEIKNLEALSGLLVLRLLDLSDNLIESLNPLSGMAAAGNLDELDLSRNLLDLSGSSPASGFVDQFEMGGTNVAVDDQRSQRAIDLRVTLEADPRVPEDLDRWEAVFTHFAEAVYEMTEGAHKIRKLVISRSGQNKELADVFWNGRESVWPWREKKGTPHVKRGLLANPQGRINMYEIQEGDSEHDLLEEYDYGGYAMAHELGHYLYGLLDEYEKDKRSGGIYQPRENDIPVEPSLMEKGADWATWSSVEVFKGGEFRTFSGPDFLNFSVANDVLPAEGSFFEINDATAQYRVREASAWETLVRDPKGNPGDPVVPELLLGDRPYFPELAAWAPTGEPTIQLPSADATELLDVVWLDDREVVQIVIDKSGSMNSDNKIEFAKVAAKLVVMLRNPGAKVGLVTYNESGDVLESPRVVDSESDEGELISLIDGIVADDGTDIAAGASVALSDLLGHSTAKENRAVLFLADGEGGEPSVSLLQQYKDAGVPIYSFAFGSGADGDTMLRMAAATDGKYYSAPADLRSLTERFHLANAEASADVAVSFGDVRVPAGGQVGIPLPVDSSIGAVKLACVFDGDALAAGVELVAPSGIHQPDYTIHVPSVNQTLVYFEVEVGEDEAGDWQLAAYGGAVDTGFFYGISSKVVGATFDVQGGCVAGDRIRTGSDSVLTVAPSLDTDIAGAVVRGRAIAPDGSESELEFRDDGVAPDQLADDGMYAASFNFAQEGDYTFYIEVSNENGEAELTTRGALFDGDGEDARIPIPINFLRTTAFTVVSSTMVNGNPVAVDDDVAFDAAGEVMIDVLGNDFDPDGDTLDVVSISQPDGGVAVLNGDDTITFTPGDASSCTFHYRVIDGNGGEATGAVRLQLPWGAGLVAHYPFDGNLLDVTANANDGIDHGGVTYVEGMRGQAAEFDQRGVKYAEVQHASQLVLESSFALAFWFQSISTAPGGGGRVLEKHVPTDHRYGNCFEVVLNRDFGLTFTWAWPGSPTNHESLSMSIPRSEWCHVVITYDHGANELRMYRDGELGASKTPGHAIVPINTTLPLLLMHDQKRGAAWAAEGLLDELMIFNRGLSAGDVELVFEGDAPPPFTGTIDLAARSVDALGGEYEIAVSGDGRWSVDHDLDWISVSPASGSGDGIISVLVEPNPAGVERSGTITIGGLEHVVTQLPSGPRHGIEITISPAGTGTVTVEPPPGPDGLYSAGTVVTLVSTPRVDFEFAGWGGDISGIRPRAEVVVDDDSQVIANYESIYGGGFELVSGDLDISEDGEVTGWVRDADPDGDEAAFTMLMAVSREFMFGGGDPDTGLDGSILALVKRSAGLVVNDLAGDWFIAGSNIQGGHTWDGSVSLNPAGTVVSGSVTPSNGTAIEIAGGDFSMDPGGRVRGVMELPGKDLGLTMQMTANLDLLLGEGNMDPGPEDGFFALVRRGSGFTPGDLAGMWFIAGTDIQEGHSWLGGVELDASGEFVSGGLFSSEGPSYELSSGSFAIAANGAVTASFADSAADPVTRTFTMQMTRNRDAMFGEGNADSGPGDGFFGFVKMGSGFDGDLFSGDWFIGGSIPAPGDRFTYDGKLELGYSGNLVSGLIRPSSGMGEMPEFYSGCSAGGGHAAVIDEDGLLWTWGDNSYGQLGNGSADDEGYDPAIVGAARWKQVACGNNHSLAIRSDETLWVWGDNRDGQLGTADYDLRYEPHQIEPGKRWKHVASKGDYSMAIDEGGKLWAWGVNYAGQLGLGENFGPDSNEPVRVNDNNWETVECGGEHTMAIDHNGVLWGWGNNSSGRLGLGDEIDRWVPAELVDGSRWMDVDCTYTHTVGIKTNGTLWVWGFGGWGLLGTGGTEDCLNPCWIGQARTWQMVSCGGLQSFAIDSDDKLWAWGDNFFGQLGLGTVTQDPVLQPTEVEGDDWIHVATGDALSLGLRSDDTLWEWGWAHEDPARARPRRMGGGATSGGDRYLLETTIAPGGSDVSVNPPPGADGWYAPGTVVALTALPADGFSFVSWEGVDGSSGGTASVTVGGDRVVRANFGAIGLLLSSRSQSMDADGGSVVVDVDSNGAWDVVNGLDWVTVDPPSGTGDESVTITVGENLAPDGRFGQISIGGKVFTISQGAAGPIDPELVTIGDPGNPPDDSDQGRVDHFYRIAAHEVTNREYALFLNSVAASGDPHGLYHASMAQDWSRGGIERSGPGTAVDPYSYSLKPHMGGKPVNHVSMLDAMRFCNWMHNGQGRGGTETGAYELTGNNATDGLLEHDSEAAYWIPTEDEWKKAAYHQPGPGGPAGGYWMYPTRTSSPPMTAVASSDGGVTNPGAGIANYNSGADWNQQNGHVTGVGACGPMSTSHYGTYDQGGNVMEWVEGVDSLQPSKRLLRGGSYSSSAGRLERTNSYAATPTAEARDAGFRIAAIAPVADVVLDLASRSVPAAGAGYSIQVSAEGSWQVDNPSGWVDVSAVGGIDDAVLSVTVAPNPLLAPRQASILIGDEVHEINQAASVPLTSISPETVRKGSLSQSYWIQVESNTSWSVAENLAWAAVNKTSGSGNGVVLVTLTANSGTQLRQGPIVIGGRTHTVTQDATNYWLSLDPPSNSVDREHAVYTITVSSNGPWVVDEDLDWIEVVPDSGSGNGVVTVFVEENMEPGFRQGTVGIGDGEHVVLQLGRPETYVEWALRMGLTTRTRGLTLDGDGDGLSNLEEFAHNLNPLVSDWRTYAGGGVAAGAPRVMLAGQGGDRHLTMEFIRVRGGSELVHTVEFSSDLVQWEPATAVPGVEWIGGGWERLVVADAETVATAPRRFARLRIEYVGEAIGEATYAEWAAAAGLSGAAAEPGAMPFGDGVTNLEKYAFNMNGAGPDRRRLVAGTGLAGLPSLAFENGTAGAKFRVEFLRRVGSRLLYVPMKSPDLRVWENLSAVPAVIPIDSEWERVVIEEPVDLGAQPSCFIRLCVFLPTVTYAEWAEAQGLTGADADPEAMPFGDRADNLLKYASNVDADDVTGMLLVPGTGTAGLPNISWDVSGPTPRARFDFVRRRNSGLLYVPEISADLREWSHVPSGPQVETIGTDWERVVVEYALPAPIPSCFARLRVVLIR